MDKKPIYRFEQREPITTVLRLREAPGAAQRTLFLLEQSGVFTTITPNGNRTGLAVFSDRKFAIWFRRIHGLAHSRVVVLPFDRAAEQARLFDLPLLLADNPLRLRRLLNERDAPLPCEPNTLLPIRKAITLIDPDALWLTRGRRKPSKSFEADEQVTGEDTCALLGAPFPQKKLLVIAWGWERYAVTGGSGGADDPLALAVFIKPQKARAFAQANPKASDGRRPRLRPTGIERMTLDEARFTARLHRLPALALLDNPDSPALHWVC